MPLACGVRTGVRIPGPGDRYAIAFEDGTILIDVHQHRTCPQGLEQPMTSRLPPVPAPVWTETYERDLVSRAAAGEAAPFEALMRRYNQLQFRTAYSILKSDADAEDAVQEAYLRAWRALGSFRAESRFSTWLVRIVTNEALGRLRRSRAHTIPL